ncbi:MAG: rod shape-determining protein MreC [bacterium]|nr:rod shape-determining protein MreC [bacterium]
MKRKYIVYLTIILVVLFRMQILNIFNNFSKLFLKKETNPEIEILQKEVSDLTDEYSKLLDFKNNIVLNESYTITNIYKNNYGFDKMIVNGTYKINSEVVTKDGLIGIVSKSMYNTCEVKYLDDTGIMVKISNSEGKITGKNEQNNLIIKEVSNYNDIKINDKVYSVHMTYIGKVVNILYEDLDNIIIVKPVSTDSLDYVGVIEK